MAPAAKPETAPKRGRPFVADDDRREGRIPIKVSDNERAALEAGAKAAGAKLGVWLRELGLAAAAELAPKRRSAKKP
jgi:hypothetical protein